MAELQFPNIVGQYQQGFDRGRATLADRLAGNAYGAQGPDRQAALSQLAAVDPTTAVNLGNSLRLQDAAQNELQQSQQKAHADKINGAAKFMVQALETKDPARIQGAYQTVKPYLAELGAAQGKVPPDQFDPSMTPMVYQLAGASGGLPDPKTYNVSPGSKVVDAAGNVITDNPSAPANGQIVKVPDGRGGTVDMIFDPRTHKLTRPDFGASQQGPDLGAINAKAGELVNSGQMTPEQADAWIKQQYAAAGVPIDSSPVGGLGYNPPSQKQAVTLSPAELKAAGLPDGTVAQRDENGKITVVSRPPQVSPDKLADIAAKRQKARAAQQETLSNIDDSIGQIDTLLKSPGFSNIGTFTGDTFGRIPHTDTADARAQLDTVGNQSLLTTLGSMKSLSATGASGFGALSDSEGRILRNAAANLTESQSNAALKQHLLDYKAKLQRTRQRLASMQVQLPEDAVSGGRPAQGITQQGGQDFSHLWGN